MPLVYYPGIDNFYRTKDSPPKSIDTSAISSVKSLHETEELEPWIQAILFDTNETPHGPSEIADIFTHKLTVKGACGLAAFILQGKIVSNVRPKHVSHQIYRLEKIPDLKYAVLAASGNVPRHSEGAIHIHMQAPEPRLLHFRCT